MKFILLLVLVSFQSAWANSKVDALFAEYNRPNAPGASVTIIQGGVVQYQNAYGLARLNGSLKATSQTNYRLASLSKQFTATAILILIERGKLTLETRLTDIFPDFPGYGRNILMRHLLTHQSGLRDYEDLIPSSQSSQVSDHDVLEIEKNQSYGMFSPGSQYHYSNAGYAVLAEIVAKVSGESYAEFAKKNIFEPLGMAGSILYEKGISEVRNRAYGHSPTGGGFSETDQSITSAVLGDGGVYTSVEDWLLWERSLNNHAIVSEPMQKLAFTPATLNSGARTNYGFGWMLDTYRGYLRQHHTGSTIGFRTAVQRLPEKKLCVVVLVNRANSAPWSIAESVLDLYLNE